MKLSDLSFTEKTRTHDLVFARINGYTISFSKGARKAFSDFFIEEEDYILARNDSDQSDKKVYISHSSNFPKRPAFQLKFYSTGYMFNCRNVVKKLGYHAFAGSRVKVYRDKIENIDFLIVDPQIKVGQ